MHPTMPELQGAGPSRVAMLDFASTNDRDQFAAAARMGKGAIAGHPVRPIRATPSVRLIADTPANVAAAAALGAAPGVLTILRPERLIVGTARKRPVVRARWLENAHCLTPVTDKEILETAQVRPLSRELARGRLVLLGHVLRRSGSDPGRAVSYDRFARPRELRTKRKPGCVCLCSSCSPSLTCLCFVPV